MKSLNKLTKSITILFLWVLLCSSCNRKNEIYEDALKSAFQVKYGLAIDVLESKSGGGRTEALVQLSRNHEYQFWVSVDKNNEDLQDDFFIEYAENEIKKGVKKNISNYYNSNVNSYVSVEISAANTEQPSEFLKANSLDEIIKYLSEEDTIDILIFIDNTAEKQNQNVLDPSVFLDDCLLIREKTEARLSFVDKEKIEEMQECDLFN